MVKEQSMKISMLVQLRVDLIRLRTEMHKDQRNIGTEIKLLIWRISKPKGPCTSPWSLLLLSILWYILRSLGAQVH